MILIQNDIRPTIFLLFLGLSSCNLLFLFVASTGALPPLTSAKLMDGIAGG